MIAKTLLGGVLAVLVSGPVLADIWECEFGQSETEEATGLLSVCSATLNEVTDTETIAGCASELPDERIPIRNLVLDTVTLEARWEEHRQRPPHLRPARVEWLMARDVTREEAERLAARVRVFPFEGFVLSHTVSSGRTYSDPITDEYIVEESDRVIATHTLVFHDPWENRTFQLLSDGLSGDAFLIEPLREGTGTWLEIRFGQCVITEVPEDPPAAIEPESADD